MRGKTNDARVVADAALQTARDDETAYLAGLLSGAALEASYDLEGAAAR